MCKTKYTRVCQVCNTEYPATLKKDGTPRKTKYKVCSDFCRSIAAGNRRPDTPRCTTPQRGVKVMVTCKFCGVEFGPFKAGEARRRSYCSRECSAKSKTHTLHPDGTWARPTTECKFCGKTYEFDRNNRHFCSLRCASTYNHTGMNFREYEAYRLSIEDHKKIELDRRLRVAPETSALGRIKRNIHGRTRACSACGISHVRRRSFVRTCSKQCEQAYIETAIDRRKEWRLSEEGRAVLRAAKSRRKALERGARKAGELVDPYEVFDDAGWKCYICGVDTPESKRGTYDDDAPELEHIVPVSKGGNHFRSNLACACRKCNQAKGDQLLEEFLENQ